MRLSIKVPVVFARLYGLFRALDLSSWSHLSSLLIRFAGVLALLFYSGYSQAGNQKEEAMADSVQLALSHSIKDARPPQTSFADIDQRIVYLRWLGEMSDRLKKKLPDIQMRLEFLKTTWYEARRAGLDPGLVLGLMQVESNFRKYAVSSAGARGYMQVMPFWSRVVGDSDPGKLFSMQANLRYGCSILRMYIDMEGGNLFFALGRYNGSRGRDSYPNAVLTAWKRWEYKF